MPLKPVTAQAHLENGFRHSDGPDELIEINTGVEVGSFEQMDDILCGHVAGGSRGEWTAAEPTDSGIEFPDAVLGGCPGIGKGQALRVVEMG